MAKVERGIIKNNSMYINIFKWKYDRNNDFHVLFVSLNKLCD